MARGRQRSGALQQGVTVTRCRLLALQAPGRFAALLLRAALRQLIALAGRVGDKQRYGNYAGRAGKDCRRALRIAFVEVNERGDKHGAEGKRQRPKRKPVDFVGIGIIVGAFFRYVDNGAAMNIVAGGMMMIGADRFRARLLWQTGWQCLAPYPIAFSLLSTKQYPCPPRYVTYRYAQQFPPLLVLVLNYFKPAAADDRPALSTALSPRLRRRARRRRRPNRCMPGARGISQATVRQPTR